MNELNFAYMSINIIHKRKCQETVGPECMIGPGLGIRSQGQEQGKFRVRVKTELALGVKVMVRIKSRKDGPASGSWLSEPILYPMDNDFSMYPQSFGRQATKTVFQCIIYARDTRVYVNAWCQMAYEHRGET